MSSFFYCWIPKRLWRHSWDAIFWHRNDSKNTPTKCDFLENVKNLKSHDNGRTFAVIKNTLENLGYVVFDSVLNPATHANIPQNRERIFIVAFHQKKVQNFANFRFPSPIKLTRKISDLIEQERQDDIFYYTPQRCKFYDQLESAMQNLDTLYQWRRHYVRENKSNLCPTLTANMGTGGHNVPLLRDDFGIRKLTPKECFLFQGYESIKLPNISNSALYKQAGNSITLPLVKRVCDEILKVLCDWFLSSFGQRWICEIS